MQNQNYYFVHSHAFALLLHVCRMPLLETHFHFAHHSVFLRCKEYLKKINTLNIYHRCMSAVCRWSDSVETLPCVNVGLWTVGIDFFFFYQMCLDSIKKEIK